jgi:hypothetical protein
MSAKNNRLRERAEALDDACLRAWGHPDDYAIRQEILSALEWDDGFRAEQAGLLLRRQMKQVQGHAAGLSDGIRPGADHRYVAAHALYHGIQSFRRSLVALVHDLAVGRREPD